MLDLPVLNNTLRECGFKLPRTSNVGRSGDWEDLYYLTDYLTFVLDRHYDAQPCKAGCSECCRENTVFRVTPTEWLPIRAFLEQSDPAWVDAMRAIDAEETRRFVGYYDAAKKVPEVVARAERSID
jgi:hypothetical protein